MEKMIKTNEELMEKIKSYEKKLSDENEQKDIELRNKISLKEKEEIIIEKDKLIKELNIKLNNLENDNKNKTQEILINEKNLSECNEIINVLKK